MKVQRVADANGEHDPGEEQPERGERHVEQLGQPPQQQHGADEQDRRHQAAQRIEHDHVVVDPRREPPQQHAVAGEEERAPQRGDLADGHPPRSARQRGLPRAAARGLFGLPVAEVGDGVGQGDHVGEQIFFSSFILWKFSTTVQTVTITHHHHLTNLPSSPIAPSSENGSMRSTPCPPGLHPPPPAQTLTTSTKKKSCVFLAHRIAVYMVWVSFLGSANVISSATRNATRIEPLSGICPLVDPTRHTIQPPATYSRGRQPLKLIVRQLIKQSHLPRGLDSAAGPAVPQPPVRATSSGGPRSASWARPYLAIVNFGSLCRAAASPV